MSSALIGHVNVLTSAPGRGWTPEEVGERCVDKLIQVADTAPQPIRDQAIAFREQARRLIVAGMHEAVRSSRTTMILQLRSAGQHEAASLIEKGL